MVLVNVYVPVLDQQFEFNLDEETRISNLLMEMGEMLKQIQMEEEIDQQDSLVLSDLDQKRVLSGNHTLAAYGITNGAKLMLT